PTPPTVYTLSLHDALPIFTPAQAEPVLVESGTTLGQPERVAAVAKRPGASLRGLLVAAGVPCPYSADVVAAAEIELKYDGYLARDRKSTRLNSSHGSISYA